MKIDAHQHFWKYDATEYPWIGAGTVLERSWMPEDLRPILEGAGMDGCVAVQARQSMEESRWLLDLAEEHSWIRGVVGWVDLRSERVDEELGELMGRRGLVGVRHVVQDEVDEDFLGGGAFCRGVGKLAGYGLAYDLLIYARQLESAVRMVERFPEQRFVIDHLAKPEIRLGKLEGWREWMKEMGKFPQVMCKVSGMVTEAAVGDWKAEDLRPYMEVVLEVFGVDRLMFGSDWPVCLLAADYGRVLGVVEGALEGFSAEDRAKIFGGNALRFYGLEG
jgi:L-fuconolactonase